MSTDNKPTPPADKAQTDARAAGSAAARGAVDAVKGAVGAPAAETTEEKEKRLAKEKDEKEKKDKGSNWGAILGGLFGGLLAYIFGGIFGEGAVGTMLTVALAVPMIMIGSNQFGDTINGWLGRPKAADAAKSAPGKSPGKSEDIKQASAPVQGQSVAQAAALATDKGVSVVAQKAGVHTVHTVNGQTVTRFTDEALNALVDAAKTKGVQSETIMFTEGREKGVFAATITGEPKGAELVTKNQIPVAKVAEAMHQCKTKVGVAAIDLYSTNGGFNMGCVPNANLGSRDRQA